MLVVQTKQKNTPEQAKPTRNTFKNSLDIVKQGDKAELKKIARRRSLNTLKVAKRVVLYIPRAINNHPSVKVPRESRRLKKVLQDIYELTTKDTEAKQAIAIIIRDGTHYPKSSAFIRLIGPLSQELIRKKYRVSIHPENTTILPEGTRICIVQRTAFDSVTAAQELLDEVKNKQCRLIIDSDDAFTVIDQTHPEHSEHRERIAALELLLQEADSVWLSTRALGDVYPKTKKQPVVIQNYLDRRVWGSRDIPTATDNKINMVYMGTATHDADLEMIMPALHKLHNDFPGSFTLHVIGVSSALPDVPWITRLQPNKTSLYPLFVQWFVEQGPFDIGLSPLVDSPFNQCKSDIKCLDYFAVGALPVVSDITPYKTPELDNLIVRVSNTSDEWYEALANIVKNPTTSRERLTVTSQQAQEYLWKERSVEKAAEAILKELQ